MAQLSEYELQRLEHVKRNQEYLNMLGIGCETWAKQLQAASGATQPPMPAVKKRRKTHAAPAAGGATRKSSRLSNKPVDYKDYVGNDRGGRDRRRADGMPTARRSGTTRVDESTKEDEVIARPPRRTASELVANGQLWLQESRAALLALGAPGNPELVSGEEGAWKLEAARRWGDKCVVSSGSWEKYVLSRMATPPPASPMDLLQEYYAHCPWRLLVSCCLMSRVSSHATKHRVIAQFFEAYPTPSLAIDADPSDLLKIMHPLGLFDNRLRSLVSVTQRFLEMPEFNVGLEKELKIYGIGVFGYQSFLIFCRNRGREINPVDRTLASFVAWLKKTPTAKAGATAKAEATAQVLVHRQQR